MENDNFKRYAVLGIAALAIGFFVWWIWVRKEPYQQNKESGRKVMSSEEVDQALKTLGAQGGPPKNRALTPQEVEQALKSLGAQGGPPTGR